MRHAGIYLVAVAIFLAASTPSWVPRLAYFGDPFHHGYLENYMWVDTYKEGHVGQSYATYTWRDYFAHHHVRDVVSRLSHGLRNIYFRIPIMMERIPIAFFVQHRGGLDRVPNSCQGVSVSMLVPRFADAAVSLD